MTDWPPLI